MSMRGAAVAGCLVLACVVALLDRTDGHITFFSPKEMMLMKEREGRKDMEPRTVEDGQFEDGTVQQLPLEELGTDSDKTLEIAVRLSPKQLNHVAPVHYT